jgi:glycosyltransferase involved in cell wall biosynthesis
MLLAARVGLTRLVTTMRILYLSQLIPYPADAGPKVRSYHVLQYLASAGHQVTLVAFCRPADKPEQVAHLKQYCTDIYSVPMNRSRLRDAWFLGSSLVSKRPFLIARDNVPAMHRTLRDLMANQPFDAIHADQLWMAQYALAAKQYHHRQPHPRTTLDQHNAVYLIPQRLMEGTADLLKRALLAMEARKMARYEVETCQQFDRVVWVTQEDQQAVASQKAKNGRSLNGQEPEAGRSNPHEPACVIPICVDPDVKTMISPKPQARRVTFLGGLHWPPNAEGLIWFANEVWPRVLQQCPDAILTVIGKDPPRPLADRANSDKSLDVTGYVDDPLPYLAETAAFIVPLHAGGGMRVKILDAWSWGLPIVSTSIGAEGTLFRDGSNLIIADDAAAFAGAIVRLLGEPALAHQLGAAGRHTIETDYDWQRIYRAWDSIYSPKKLAEYPPKP